MRKTHKGLTVLLGASFLLGGCGGDDEFTIQFWTPLTGDDGANMDEIVKQYNDTDPEFKVNHVITSDIYTKLYTVLNSGNGVPDLTIIHADRVPSFAGQDLLEPMTDIMAQQPELKAENYLTEAWTAGEVDGTQYTIPLDIHGNVMYYNKDLLAKYGVEHFLDDNVVTFDELLSLQGQMEEGDYVITDGFVAWTILAQVQNLGGSTEDENGNPTIDTPEMKQSIEQVKALADAGLMTPYGEDGYLFFQAGDVLFTTSGTWESVGHAQVEGLNYGVTNVYAFEPETFHNRASAHLFSMLNKEERTDEKEAGIGEFLEFMRENSIEWAEAGQIVASVDVIESPEYENYLQSFFTETEEERESLYISNYRYAPYISDALFTYAPDMVHGQLDVDQGIAEMQRFVEDKIEQGEMDMENVLENIEDEEEE